MQNSFNSNSRIEDQFHAIAKQFPNDVAICCNALELTYEELDQQSNIIANMVKDNLDEGTTYVGLLMDRGVHMIISILGILKAGVAYIPIDPVNNPTERIKLCFSGANLNLVITDRRVEVADVTTLLIEEETFRKGVTDQVTGIRKSEIAYAIFTSGTTGVPKGVPITHENVLGLFRNASHVFEFHKDDIWTLFHSFAFDFSVWEIWGALLYGARLEIVPNNVAKNIARFRRFLFDKKVTILNQTPSAFYNLIKMDMEKDTAIASLKYVILGGEKLDMPLLEPWVEKYGASSRLYSGYGTTETTVFTSFKYMSAQDLAENADLSPLGEPIPGSEMILFNEEGKVTNKGELYICGEALSKGYLNRPDLNEIKFIRKNINGKSMDCYRTGDLAFEQGGELYCIGRIDSQVKFNGYRIELEEIQNVTMSHPGIMRSIVTLDNSTGRPRLVNFLKPTDHLHDEVHLVNEVEELSKNKLPFYMIPSDFMVIDEIPLTTNGKTDYRKLSELCKVKTPELAMAV